MEELENVFLSFSELKGLNLNTGNSKYWDHQMS